MPKRCVDYACDFDYTGSTSLGPVAGALLWEIRV